VRRGKEREAHFKQIVAIYHEEMDKLKEVNDSLREQLEALYQQAQQAQQEADELRSALADCQAVKSAVRDSEEVLKRRKDLELCISPIEKGREPIVIKRFSEKLLSELDSPTFSQLLAGTPQVSSIEPEALQAGEKENALKAEFERLMG
jgi:chromosome segregation ATPase